jgi:aldose 1-epimerase
MTPGLTDFGTSATGETVHRIALSNGTLSAAILTRGIALQDVRLDGVDHSLTVGFPTLAPYETTMSSAGTLVGPIGNRIGGASAMIDGHRFDFHANFNGKHTLHGGGAATHKRLWTLTDHTDTHVELTLNMPDAEHGFPGNRTLTARYDITDATLRLTLTATTDAPTLMNLANHSYWRLDDHPTFDGHTLRVAADHYLPTTVDDVLPTGQIADVTNTRFDYRTARRLTPATDGLIDNNFCLSQTRQPLRPVAWLTGTSGLTMEMATTEPGLQVFDGHILSRSDAPGNDGTPYQPHAALALEAQFWPDATNNPDFPSIILRPEDRWQQVTTWSFAR